MKTFGKVRAFALAGVVALMFSTSDAMATSIVGLYNTGVDNLGVATPEANHGADLHWLLNGGPAYTGTDNVSFPTGPWVLDTSSSRWITPTPNAADSFDPSSDGFYHYTLDFSLASTAGASLSALFAADNVASIITLNGNTLLTNAGGFTFWTSFSANSSDFLVGNNELEIVVENFAQNGGNPTGLNVQFLSAVVTSSVPEPASWLMLILGFGSLGALLRSRRGLAFAA